MHADTGFLALRAQVLLIIKTRQWDDIGWKLMEWEVWMSKNA
ncbi:hypothetical protein [Microcoleus sp. PH2017_08_TRC_O_A]|nr:hypothetical protein [Microcoleus sp. PH2017_08_TRC_O_A]